jgi:hypothetical protein
MIPAFIPHERSRAASVENIFSGRDLAAGHIFLRRSQFACPCLKGRASTNSKAAQRLNPLGLTVAFFSTAFETAAIARASF